MKIDRETSKRILALLGIALLMIWLVQRLQFVPTYIGQAISFFSPLLIAIFIAFVVNLPMRWIEKLLFGKKWKNDNLRLKLKRPLSLVLALSIVIGIIVAIFFMILPDLISTVVSFTTQLPRAIQEVQEWASSMDSTDSELLQWLASSTFSINNMIQRGINWLNNIFADLASSLFTWVSSILNGFVNTFFGFVFAIYFLVQKEKISKQFKQIAYAIFSETHVDSALKLGKLVNSVFSGFISGQGLEALILGFLNFIGMSIFSFPYPLTISVLVVVGALIPIFGAFISAAFGALLIMVESPLMGFGYLAMILVIQQIEGNFIYPRVVGKSVGLPAHWVLFAVTFGSKLFGFLGMLLSVPAFSVFYVLLRSWSRVQVQKKGISEEKIHGEPFPLIDENYKSEKEEPLTFFGEDDESLVEEADQNLKRLRVIEEGSSELHTGEKSEMRVKDRGEESRKFHKEKAKHVAEPSIKEYEEAKVRPSAIHFDLDRFAQEVQEETQAAKAIRKEAWDRTLELVKKRKSRQFKSDKNK